MTRRVLANGRSGAPVRSGYAKRWKLETPFIGHTLALRESSAFRSLTWPARHVLDFLELEHMRHAGTENGRLLAPYEQLVRFGLSRRDIRPALDMLEAFGIVKCTSPGERLGGRPKAATYRLTYYPSVEDAQPTDDFRRVGLAEVHQFIAERRALRRAKLVRRSGSTASVPDPLDI